jgi:hypothetical protein
VFEAAATILIGAAGRLHDPVERVALAQGDLSHLFLRSARAIVGSEAKTGCSRRTHRARWWATDYCCANGSGTALRIVSTTCITLMQPAWARLP